MCWVWPRFRPQARKPTSIRSAIVPQQINFQHTHLGNTRQWMNKSVTNLEACGTGENPSLFKHPPLIPAGDTLTCIVTNLLNAQQRVQVLLLGGIFDECAASSFRCGTGRITWRLFPRWTGISWSDSRPGGSAEAIRFEWMTLMEVEHK